MDAQHTGVTLEPVSDPGGGQPYRVRYDRETTPPGIAVAAAVAEMKRVDPSDLEPLQNVVDTEALAELMRPRSRTAGSTQVSFDYEGVTVTIASTGLITIAPTSAPTRTEGATHR